MLIEKVSALKGVLLLLLLLLFLLLFSVKGLTSMKLFQLLLVLSSQNIPLKSAKEKNIGVIKGCFHTRR